MPRSHALTDQVQSAVIEAVRAGVPYEVAAVHGGIDRGTFWRWMELGKPEQGCITPEDKGKQTAVCPEAAAGQLHEPGECPHLSRFRDFRDAVVRAEADLHTLLAGQVVKATGRDWHAGMAVLKAKWPKTWNVPVITQIEGGLEVDVTISVRDSVRAKLEELHERGLLALPSGRDDDGERIDDEKETEDDRPEPRKRHPRAERITDTTAREPEPEPARKRRGPAVA